MKDLLVSFRQSRHRGRARRFTLDSLLKKRRFDVLESIMKEENSITVLSLSLNKKKQEDNNDDNDELQTTDHLASVLTVTLQHQPPASLIYLMLQKLLEVNPGYVPEAAVDEMGKTPLHIAAASGCNVDVLKCLTSKTELPVVTIDNQGRYPLHWACISRNKKQALANVLYLIELYPQAVTCRDLDGCTPMDLVKSKNSRIINTLQTVRNIIEKIEIVSITEAATTDEYSKNNNITRVSNNTDELLPVREVLHENDDNDDDDMSSIGSRGISKPRRVCNRICI